VFLCWHPIGFEHTKNFLSVWPGSPTKAFTPYQSTIFFSASSPIFHERSTLMSDSTVDCYFHPRSPMTRKTFTAIQCDVTSAPDFRLHHSQLVFWSCVWTCVYHKTKSSPPKILASAQYMRFIKSVPLCPDVFEVSIVRGPVSSSVVTVPVRGSTPHNFSKRLIWNSVRSVDSCRGL
jgi:hypothetical protein